MSEVIQRSFSGGEISPSLYARVDQVKYATGLRTLRNYFVKRHGAAQSRPGTTFIAEIKDSSETVRLIPFIFNNDQTYVLEFGDQYIRFYRNGAQITLADQNITGITNANPAVVTITAHGYSNGDEVFISGVVGMPEINNRNYLVANVTANTFELTDLQGNNIDATGFGTYSSGGTAAKVYELATTYLEADLPEIRFAQSADVITLTHPSYPPRELARTGHTSWTITDITFAPVTTAPTGLSTDKQGGTVFTHNYFVTAVSDIGEESLLASGSGLSNTSPASSPVTVSWTASPDAAYYRVYRTSLGSAPYGRGLISEVAQTTSLIDDDTLTLDPSAIYPDNDNPFGSSDNYPTAVSYYQGRLCFANTNNSPETVWMSHSGSFKNFAILFPNTDAGRVVFTIAGNQVQSIKHMVDLGTLILFTDSGEWSLQGNDAGIVTPTEINPLQQSYNGSSRLAPIVINDTAIYVQTRGSKVRDLKRSIDVAGYSGNDLSIFSSHLFEDYTLVDWAYQKIPDSIVWAVRSDGTLLSMTYVTEQQITAWSRHDFENGTVENVVVIPDGNEDRVYLVIKRTIDGTTKRYIEKLNTRNIITERDLVMVDSSLTYDGNNTNTSNGMTLSGGTTWAYDETLTLTAGASTFLSTDVGLQVHLRSSDGDIIRFTIEGFTSATVVTGKPHKTVPTSLRNTATTDWGIAVKELYGLWNLDGETVSVQGDAFVVASPNNPSHATITVSDGKITLDKHHTTIHAGLPITADIETLDIDTLSGETMADKKKIITSVAVHMEETRGLWAGELPPSDDDDDPLKNLREFRPRNSESAELPARLKTEVDFVNIKGTWNKGGRVFIRQIDPVPSTILAIIPAGFLPVRS